jgi:fatty-acyl-CoA synthase
VPIRPSPKAASLSWSAAGETLPNAVDYESLIADEPAAFAWPRLDENSAAIMCFTSATTADPKAVLFSHRSTFLHALATAAAGVPTVWFALRDALHARGAGLPTLERIVIGGSAVPPALFDDLEALGTRVIHAWGMTKMSPIGTVSTVTAELSVAATEIRRRERLKQGPFSVLVDWKILADDGREVAAGGVCRRLVPHRRHRHRRRVRLHGDRRPLQRFGQIRWRVDQLG